MQIASIISKVFFLKTLYNLHHSITCQTMLEQPKMIKNAFEQFKLFYIQVYSPFSKKRMYCGKMLSLCPFICLSIHNSLSNLLLQHHWSYTDKTWYSWLLGYDIVFKTLCKFLRMVFLWNFDDGFSYQIWLSLVPFLNFNLFFYHF